MKPRNARKILYTLAIAGFFTGPSAPFFAPATGDFARAARISSFGEHDSHRMSAPRESVRRMRGDGRRFTGGGGGRGDHRRYGKRRGFGGVFSGPRFQVEIRIGRNDRAGRRKLGPMEAVILASNTTYKAFRSMKKLIRDRLKATAARRKNGYLRTIHRRYGIAAIDSALRKIAARMLRDKKRLSKKPVRSMKHTFERRVREIGVVLGAIRRARKALKARIRRLKAQKTRNEKYHQALKDQDAPLKKIADRLIKIRDAYRFALKAGVH